MCVWGVRPGGIKVLLHLDLLHVGDDKPRDQLSKNLEDHAFVLSHVFFVEGLDVLLVNVHDDCLDAHLVNDLLVDVLRSHSQPLLAELEVVFPFGIILDFRVDKIRLSDTAAVEVIFIGNDAHFVLVENKRGRYLCFPRHDVVGKLLA